jgi:NTP pyrophosphatase (non-canonical NTP hydrolase)
VTDYQHEIVSAVYRRGYRVRPDGTLWTDDQYAARQVAKLVEELGELVVHAGPALLQRWEHMLMSASANARRHFDDMDGWESVAVGREAAAEELADLQVVIFNMADALGVDVLELALEKARGDIERGVR